MTTEEIIDGLLKREGGFVNRPEDAGGPTSHGITQATLKDWRRKDVTVNDVAELTEDEAREIYRWRYIRDPGFEAIKSDALRTLVVDAGVNHGTSRATKMLQKALEVKEDGVFGAVTLAALSDADTSLIYRRVCAARVRLYGHLITKDPEQSAFAAGWANRIAEFIEAT